MEKFEDGYYEGLSLIPDVFEKHFNKNNFGFIIGFITGGIFLLGIIAIIMGLLYVLHGFLLKYIYNDIY